MAERPVRRRCAIYTRKSSEEGLDQAYNSLDAQRDACRAYILSQKHEGWVPLEKAYDDGGFSGGSLQRPALRALLDDVEKGQVDIIVVYKIDRLTRSLADFAKLTEQLDRHQVSFVAVTQQFNTSTSMGRLTLNVLLSFAQFEREVAGERIRDKIAASKKRGMWMGGHPPLGYDVRDRKLVANEAEARTVRHVFDRYLALKSVRLLKQDLDAGGFRSKKTTWQDGSEHGGASFSRGALYTILRNQTYRGLVTHKGAAYPGDHPAIVDDGLFHSVQATLADQGPGEAARVKRKSGALLRGLAFDAAGDRLVPDHCRKKGERRYSYYASANRRKDRAASGIRVPAGDLDRIVTSSLASRLRDRHWVAASLAAGTTASVTQTIIGQAASLAARLEQMAIPCDDTLRSIVRRVEVSPQAVRIRVMKAAFAAATGSLPTDEGHEADNHDDVEITISGQFLRCGKQVRLVLGSDQAGQGRPDDRLVGDIVRARRWFDDLASGRAASIADLARCGKCSAPYVSRKISLAFLAPDIVRRIVEGTQPPGLTPERLKQACPLPVSWDEQRARLLA